MALCSLLIVSRSCAMAENHMLLGGTWKGEGKKRLARPTDQLIIRPAPIPNPCFYLLSFSFKNKSQNCVVCLC